MDIIVKVTDAELAEMGINEEALQVWIGEDIERKGYACNSVSVEIINTDDAKRAIKTTKDKHLAIMNCKYEG